VPILGERLLAAGEFAQLVISEAFHIAIIEEQLNDDAVRITSRKESLQRLSKLAVNL
jgi:hypothetical protein